MLRQDLDARFITVVYLLLRLEETFEVPAEPELLDHLDGRVRKTGPRLC